MKIEECAQIADAALQQVRTLMLDLRPPQLDELGLAVALRTHAERVVTPANLALHFSVPVVLPEMPPAIEIVCFRIAQEVKTTSPYREVDPDFAPYADDLKDADDDNFIDRKRLGVCLKSYMEQKRIEADLSLIERAPAETLINSLSMICPFAPAEKQALLEAGTLADRAQLLTTLIEMAATGHGGTLQ